MEKLLSDLSTHTLAWPFQQPVNADEVPDYFEVIKQPMGACVTQKKATHPLSSFVYRFQHYGTQA